jgi:hypothetical protein
MSARRSFLSVLILVALSTAVTCRALAGSFTGYVNNPDSVTIAYSFGYWDDPNLPADHPEWVGFDVYRRTVADCGPTVRVNLVPFPREPGHSYSYTYTESPPAQRTLYEYWAVFVDADRNPVFFSSPPCYPCASNAYGTSPPLSAVATKGTLEDWGWTLALVPCATTCYPRVYLGGCCMSDLQPYVGTPTVVGLFGSIACGTVEGCALNVDHFELSGCEGPTPVRSTSWGRLKLLYR